jgi:hypothetical protein
VGELGCVGLVFFGLVVVLRSLRLRGCWSAGAWMLYGALLGLVLLLVGLRVLRLVGFP